MWRRRSRGRKMWWQLVLAAMIPAAALTAFAIAAERAHDDVFRHNKARVLNIRSGDVTALIRAIELANKDQRETIINLEAGVYTVRVVDNVTNGPNGLPSITGTLTIRGQGADSTIITRDVDAPVFRIMHVASTGVLTVSDLTIIGTDVSFSNALLNLGELIVSSSTITGNSRSSDGVPGLTDLASFGTLTVTGSSTTGSVASTTSSGNVDCCVCYCAFVPPDNTAKPYNPCNPHPNFNQEDCLASCQNFCSDISPYGVESVGFSCFDPSCREMPMPPISPN
jgi:hypothetical protein